MQSTPPSPDSFFEELGFPRIFMLVLSLAFLHLSVQVGLDALVDSPLLSSALASLLVLILLPMIFVRSVGVPLQATLGLRIFSLREFLLLTVLTLATALPVDWITGWNLELIPPPEGLAESMAELRPTSPLGWIAAVVVLCVVGPVGEELVFRGLLQRGAERIMGPRQAVLLAAALFAAVHLQPYFVAGLFVVGLMVGLVYQRTQSLLACIYVHGLYNLLSVASWAEEGAEESSWTDGSFGPALALAGAVLAWWVLRQLSQPAEPETTSTIGRWSDPD